MNIVPAHEASTAHAESSQEHNPPSRPVRPQGLGFSELSDRIAVFSQETQQTASERLRRAAEARERSAEADAALARSRDTLNTSIDRRQSDFQNRQGARARIAQDQAAVPMIAPSQEATGRFPQSVVRRAGPTEIANAAVGVAGLRTALERVDLGQLRQHIVADWQQNSGSAQPLVERHNNILDHSVAPSHNPQYQVNGDQSAAVNIEADIRRDRAAAAQANIADLIGENLAPLVGNEPIFNTMTRALEYVNKDDRSLIHEFATEHGKSSKEELEHPFDHLFAKAVDGESHERLSTIARDTPGLEAFANDSLKTRQNFLFNASGLFLARKAHYARPTRSQAAAAVVGASVADAAGGMGAANAAVAAGLATALSTAGAVGSMALGTTLLVRNLDFQNLGNMARHEALNRLRDEVKHQAENTPAAMRSTTQQLYSNHSLTTLNRLLNGNGDLLAHYSGTVDKHLDAYLGALKNIDREMGESAENALSRVGGLDVAQKLFAAILRESRLLREIQNHV